MGRPRKINLGRVRYKPRSTNAALVPRAPRRFLLLHPLRQSFQGRGRLEAGRGIMAGLADALQQVAGLGGLGLFHRDYALKWGAWETWVASRVRVRRR